jgi:predicted CXXCH cytochrome family protein
MNRPHWQRVAALASMSVIPMVLWACSAETRYRTLNFFFDGVPGRPGTVSAAGTKAERATSSTLAGAAVGPHAAKRPVAAVLPIVSSHPDVVKKACKSCHDPQRGLRPFADEGKLCDRCHGETRKRGQWNHGPINTGSCLPCHRAHDSPYPHLLDKPIPDLCLVCHEKKNYGAAAQHDLSHISPNIANCTRCHDPHRMR